MDHVVKGVCIIAFLFVLLVVVSMIHGCANTHYIPAKQENSENQIWKALP